MARRFDAISNFNHGHRRHSRPRTRRTPRVHWHPNADEWQYVIEGDLSVTMFASDGRFRTELLHSGDVGYIPQGYGHSIENVGSSPSRIVIGFNSGIYQSIDLSAWIAGNPVDVLATNFNKPASLFEKFPRKDVFISPNQ